MPARQIQPQTMTLVITVPGFRAEDLFRLMNLQFLNDAQLGTASTRVLRSFRLAWGDRFFSDDECFWSFQLAQLGNINLAFDEIIAFQGAAKIFNDAILQRMERDHRQASARF